MTTVSDPCAPEHACALVDPLHAHVSGHARWWRFVDTALLPALVFRSQSMGGSVPDTRNLSVPGEVGLFARLRFVAAPACDAHVCVCLIVTDRLSALDAWMKSMRNEIVLPKPSLAASAHEQVRQHRKYCQAA
jgi:hypothetical protein